MSLRGEDSTDSLLMKERVVGSDASSRPLNNVILEYVRCVEYQYFSLVRGTCIRTCGEE